MNRLRPLLLAAMVSYAAATSAQTVSPRLVPLAIEPPEEALRAYPIGELRNAGPLHLAISLPFGDAVGMQRYVDAVSDPASSAYRRYLAPSEIGNRFGMPAASVQKVADYLAAQGMTIRLVGQNRLSILADASVTQAEAAFHTKIVEYQAPLSRVLSDDRLYSFTTKLSVPSEISPLVLSVSGLESFTRPKAMNTYVTPTQIRTLYNTAPLYNGGLHGEGRTIAFSNWDGYRVGNLPPEYSEFSLPKPVRGVGSNVTIERVHGGSGGGEEGGEGDLDMQSILGIAPLCNLIVYDGDFGDLIGVLTLEADDDKADVISESYGWRLDVPTTLAAHNLHLSMSAEGITYMAASGDYGTSINYYPYPMVDPEVLAVGGTTAIVGESGNRISETGWIDGGGGWNYITYPFNTLPSYQRGTGVPKDIPFRLVPDVALNADPNTGYIVYLGGSFNIFGGTSGASPTFAGSLGVAEQQLAAKGYLKPDAHGHTRFGRIQNLLYSFNGDPSVFYDVTVGSNGTLPDGTISKAGKGWDFVTGWGAMNFDGFVARLLK